LSPTTKPTPPPQVAPALGRADVTARVKDMLLSPPLHRALLACIHTQPAPAPTAAGVAEADAEGEADAASKRQQESDAALCVTLARDLLASAIQIK